jgi:hypothetical protein
MPLLDIPGNVQPGKSGDLIFLQETSIGSSGHRVGDGHQVIQAMIHPGTIKYRKQYLLFKKSPVHFAVPAASPSAYLLE